MWKRDDAPKPTRTQDIPAPVSVPTPMPATPPPAPASVERAMIGASVIIKGELAAKENLVIAGRVEGRIELREHTLTIAPDAEIQAEVTARVVVVGGRVHGNVTATDKIEILHRGVVDGDLTAPRLVMVDGAVVHGRIDMRTPLKEATKAAGESREAGVQEPAKLVSEVKSPDAKATGEARMAADLRGQTPSSGAGLKPNAPGVNPRPAAATA